MITKDRLNELALELARKHLDDYLWLVPKQGSLYVEECAAVECFAHALIKRIEQESEVVGYMENYGVSCLSSPNAAKLIALPLVEGD